MEEDFVKIDLHIHTPESTCYQAEKSQESYLNILREAKSKELKIIAITDHNSIEGYKKLFDIKKDLITEREALSRITDSKQTKKKLSLIEKDIALFEDIVILPGIEFEVRNGIHLLVIFSKNTSANTIESFLISGGFDSGSFGHERPTVLSNWDILTLFDEASKYDCILIDAHTDSDKGIWKTIPKGILRANCFKSSKLHGVCYKSEKQKENIINALQTKEYHRKTPLAFLKFSDAHKPSEVGSQLTWVKLDKLDLASLKSALTNPFESISTEVPSIERILNKLLSDDKSMGVNDLTEESKDLFKKLVCAFHNSTGGYILIGISENKIKLGITLNGTGEDALRQTVSDHLDPCFDLIEGYRGRPKMSGYKLQNQRVVISVHIPAGTRLVSIKNDNRIYAFRKKRIVELSAAEVQAMIEERNTEEMELRVQKKLATIERDCNLITHLFSALPIMRKFESRSIDSIFRPIVSENNVLSVDQAYKFDNQPPLGKSRGNVFVLTEYCSPRLQYAYLRYTLPLFYDRSITERSKAEETVYIVPGGGVYYSNRDYPVCSLDQYPFILKLLKTHHLNLNLKFITCFLKSSFMIWYCKNKFDNVDLLVPDVFNSLRVPIVDEGRPAIKLILGKIETRFNKILQLEKQFLSTAYKLNAQQLSDTAEAHNLLVDTPASEIDHLIYELLGFSPDDIASIEENLELNEIYLPETSVLPS